MDGHDDRVCSAAAASSSAGEWMTAASTCWATSGRPLCSQASRAGRWAMAGGPPPPWHSARAARSAPHPPAGRPLRGQPRLHPALLTRPSTYRPSAPRSAGTAVASTSTRGATTSPAPFPQLFDSSCSDPVCSGSDLRKPANNVPDAPVRGRAMPSRAAQPATPPWMSRQIRAYALSGATAPPWQRVRGEERRVQSHSARSSTRSRQTFSPIRRTRRLQPRQG